MCIQFVNTIEAHEFNQIFTITIVYMYKSSVNVGIELAL